MKHLIIFTFFILSLGTTTRESLTEFLLTRKFNYELGIPTIHENNMEVHGKTFVEREIRFINDSLFQEVISNEDRSYDYHLADSSCFVSLKNGYEISVLTGLWEKENDTTIVLHFKSEKIYDMGAYIRYRYYSEQEKNKKYEIEELRSRLWTETKRLNVTDERSLCIVNGLSRCYKPNY